MVKTMGPSRKTATKAARALKMTIRWIAKPPDPTAAPARVLPPGQAFSLRGTVMPQFSLGGAAAPRRSSLFPHPTLDARMPGGAPVAHRRIALATPPLRGGSLRRTVRGRHARRPCEFAPGHMAPFPCRGRAAQSPIRPVHAVDAPGNRPTRPPDDFADRREIRCEGLHLSAARGTGTGARPVPA